MGSGREALGALEQLKPLFHPDPGSVTGALENQFTAGPRELAGAGGASYAIGRGVLAYLAELSPSDGTSVETGCGYSTVVLTSVFRTHISVNPDLASNRLVREFVERHVGNTELRHVETSSDQGLPGLVAEGCRVELALIDGNHSHPYPLLDFHYLDQMLTRDGLLLVDNTEINAVQELTEYLEMEPAYELDRLIGNCAVYRKIRDREFGWKSQTIRRPSEGIEAVRAELTRLRMELAPDLRASLNGASPLPAVPATATLPSSRASQSRPPERTSHRRSRLAVRPTSRHLKQFVRWYATPSGALAGVALLLLAVGIAAPGLWRLIGVAGVILLAVFLPYRFIREQRRTDRRAERLRAQLTGQAQSAVHQTRRLEERLEAQHDDIGALRDELAAIQRAMLAKGDADSARSPQIDTATTPARRFTAPKSDDDPPELRVRDATTALHRASSSDEPSP